MLEEKLRTSIDVVVSVIEAAGACVIVVGAVWAVVRFLIAGVRDRDAAAFTSVRLTLGRFLALGLEFLLAADILETAVAPTFEEIGKLAAIAAIRTALNYFLRHEIEQEQRAVERDGGARASARPDGGDG
ncbi:DUF1622 domain-containing protein [Saccharothrix hoggarensis]|uniref:DUF1622 domain-containing protein n=1 Tax=Saccharothrix hoggarensis TaxID=913853 RepID=A0ABW3R332_9PSEU